jgi:DNA polymerase III subunit epsilon
MFKALLQRLVLGAKREPDLNCMPERFVVFDLETTGLRADTHEVIEVAAIKYERGKPESQYFQSLIDTGARLPKKITEITGIDREMIKAEGRVPSDVWPPFVEFVEDLPLISYNYEFDGAFLSAALEKYAGGARLKNETVCALKLARRAWPGLKSYKLGDLAKMGKIDAGEAHRALSDARTALTIFSHAATKLGGWR